MRYAILSDIHGNLESLECAFALLSPDDRLLCLGDTVGYGPNPNECLKMIRERAHSTVLGNHDIAAIDNFGVEYFNPAAREAIAWTQGIIDAENVRWLNGLSYEIREPDYLLVHGAPVNYFEYILDKAGAKRALSRTDAPLVFVGHTHIAEWYALDSSGAVTHAHMQRGGELTMDADKRYIVDVGSVGQPRDLNPEASFVFYEPEKRRIEWVRYRYPIERIQEKMRAANLPETLIARLEVGR